MSDGTRIDGARSKGVIDANKVKAGKPCKGNPYKDVRPAMKAAWQEGFDSVAASSAEPAPAKPAKAPKPAKVKAVISFTGSEPDEEPALSNAEISKILDADDVLLGGD
jgi:hypothetical protein